MPGGPTRASEPLIVPVNTSPVSPLTMGPLLTETAVTVCVGAAADDLAPLRAANATDH